MEKKKKSQNPKTTSQPNPNLATKALQISDDHASQLIGSIVEKGVSDHRRPNSSPIPPPQQSLLPFPVARHRSHGPHWAPIGSGYGDDDGGGVIDEEDGASGDFDRMSGFANPLERKNKKVVDFGNWKELLSGTSSSAVAKKRERARLGSEKTEKRKSNSEAIETARKSSEDEKSCSVADMELECLNKVVEDHGTGVKKRESSDKVSSGKSFGGSEQEAVSIEAQIDVENRARLQGMSPEEIAEAQAEIMEKMDPSLLMLLKKRGEQKLKKQKSPSLDNNTNIEPNGKNEDGNEAKKMSVSEVSSAYSETKTASKSVQSGILDNGEGKNPAPGSSSLWSTWSERVERARGLRFSLDGTVVENDLDHVVDTDRVAERDFLRTEGDPGAAGYTIKEAVALTRSVIPGQRALALYLLSSALNNAVQNILPGHVGCTMRKDDKVNKITDWEAIWAYALGPEPELVLSLRMCLDDNHYSVVLACIKVIQCILTCDVNENFLDVSKKAALEDICTAPVFRSRPEIDVGFLRGGFWKYNAKSSNILNLDEDIIDDETEGKHTIQDDIVVAGQDFAAGLVRMGILPRLRYLLESDPTAALEECVVSVLVAIARHSPTCANAVMNCERLIKTVVQRFTSKDSTQIHSSNIKSVILMKVLAQSDRSNCLKFLRTEVFFIMLRNLFKYPASLDHWIKSGKENFKLYSGLMVEQLRFWKVCILHGVGVSHFSAIFTSLCFWLNPPSLEKLIENSVLGEYVSISAEAYLVLEALATRLPNFYSHLHPSNQIEEQADNDIVWSWIQARPVVDSAIEWIVLMSDLHSHRFWQSGFGSGCAGQGIFTTLLWLYSSVMSMLAEVLKRVLPDDTLSQIGNGVPWLPEFVPKVGLAIIRSKFLSFSDDIGPKFATDFIADGSVIEKLCYLRHQNEFQTSLASVCFLRKLMQTIASVDYLIQSAKKGMQSSQEYSPSNVEKILHDGILKGSMVELRSVQNAFTKLVASEWQFVQSIETFGRGGPAPGVGVGWGGSDGGYWCATVLMAQADAGLIIDLIQTFQNMSRNDVPRDEEISYAMEMINSSLAASLISGPRDRNIMDKAFKVLTHVSVLKYLDFCTRKFLRQNRIVKLFEWEYKEEDFQLFSKMLASHFSNRWLSVKTKKLKTEDSTLNKTRGSLDTIHEDSDTSNTDPVTSSVIEWAHQRLPLPVTWLLSPISTLCDSKYAGLRKCSNLENLMQDPGDRLEVSSAGLFFLLGIETISSFLPTETPSVIQSVPLVWKLHSLSVILLVGMDLIQENKSRDVYEALQDLYGDVLDKTKIQSGEIVCKDNVNQLSDPKYKKNVEFLRFQSEIHDSYSTFIETLVEQFSAISYGDLIYGRQVAIYLHQCVEAPVRLAAWNSLSNSRVLELLPPLESCFGESEGYLQPIEDNTEILKAYVKSWTSDALDRAANRGSVAYTLVLHHLSHFIFNSVNEDNQLLRNKLARSLLRDFSLKQQHQAMMLKLVRYGEQASSNITISGVSSPLDRIINSRFEFLAEACERNSSLLNEVNKLKSLMNSVA